MCFRKAFGLKVWGCRNPRLPIKFFHTPVGDFASILGGYGDEPASWVGSSHTKN